MLLNMSALMVQVLYQGRTTVVDRSYSAIQQWRRWPYRASSQISSGENG